MKKMLLLTIALVMTLSLAACGEDTNTAAQASNAASPSVTVAAAALVDATFKQQGISIKLPSDLTQTDKGGIPVYVNTETGDMVMAMDSPKEKPLATWTKDDVLEMLKDRPNVDVSSFENNKKISDKDALIAKFSYTKSKDDTTKINAAYVSIEDGDRTYSVLLSYGNKKGSSLDPNLQACFDSISYKHVEGN